VKILLDTCAFLWIISGSEKISAKARNVFADPDNEVFFSSVSAWEIAVKQSIGRIESAGELSRIVPEYRELHGIQPLPLDEESVFYLSRLPAIHNDPFDRMLVCQALAKGLVILTPDKKIAGYPARVVW